MAGYGSHVSVRDNQFCDRRLENTPGFLVCQQFGGSYRSFFTDTPSVPLPNTTATAGTPFGNFVIIGSDGAWSQMTGPASANLYLRTNAAGQFILGTLPGSTIPDPLTVGQLNTTILNVGGTATFGAPPVFNALTTGAIASVIGLDSNNQLVIGTSATTGVQTTMFFESPTSPSPATPNSGATAGSLLVIGNLIFDSVLPAVAGGALWTAINSQTIQCVTAGVYVVNYEGQVTYSGGSSGNPAIQLLVNGVVVSNGPSRPSGVTTTQRAMSISGSYSRRFAAGDQITLQLGSGSGVNTSVYEVRANLTRTGA